MTIAKGRTDCESEREIIVQGFNDLLRVLKDAKKQTEEHAKAALYDIINDNTLSDEERWTQMKPFNDLLSEQEETDIRIRRTLLIGLFSFWELSLKEVCEYYKLDIAKVKGEKQKKKKESQKGEPHYTENDYLKAIFHTERPEKIDVISSKIKQLRNYMTHGSAGEKRRNIIDNLMALHPEYCIARNCGGYHISSYDGLDSILRNICDGLRIVEKDARTIAESIKSQKI